ncbi:MAG: glycosyltransferase [Bacteriovoracaceae bacterium]|nr:glycosyltransferase [Bacteriovoracaceae bacterium]
MKVCFFNTNKAWGGGEKWHLSHALKLRDLGYETLLVAQSDSELKKRAQGVKVFDLNLSNLSFLNPFKLYKAAQILKKNQVDVLIVNLPIDLKVGGFAAKIAGVKKIVYRRGMPHPLRNTLLNRLLFKYVLDGVIVNSKEIGRTLSQGNESWFPTKKMKLVYNGVDLSHHHERAPIKFDKLIIGSAGRLTEQKGQFYLIELAKLLKSEGVDFKILLAGEGELRESLKRKIQEAQLESQIELLGHVSDMKKFFESIEIFVFPSLFEGSANTLIEALYYEVPIVAWDVSSNAEVIDEFLVKPFDISEMKNHILSLHHDQHLRQKLIEQGRVSLKEKFDSQKNLDQLLEFISL